MSRVTGFFAIVLFALSALAQSQPQPAPKPENKIPVISADLGDCSADITVTGSKLHPLYKAKIASEIRYGFGGFHRMNLEIYTNTDGQARVEGLPERPRQPLAFVVTYDGRSTTVIVHPIEKCHGSYQAIVTDKPVNTDEDEDSEQ